MCHLLCTHTPPGVNKVLLSARYFSIVRVADGFPQATVQLAAIQDDLLRMDGLNSVERHNEITPVLAVDHQLGPPVRRHLTDGAEFLAAIRYEGLIANFDVFSHDAPPREIKLAITFPCYYGCGVRCGSAQLRLRP